MMSSLTQRIVKNLSIGEVKSTPTNPDLSIVGNNQAVKLIPLTQVTVLPGAVLYEDLSPLIASDGAPITATAPGTWGQVKAAGRMG